MKKNRTTWKPSIEKESVWMRKGLCFGIILFILNATTITPAAAQKASLQTEKLTKILLDGTEATYAGDYDNAWEIFNRISVIDPTHPSREFYLATVLFWKNNTDPNNPVYDDRIVSLLEGCINTCEVLLEKDPKDIEALHYIGLAYTYRGRLDAHRGRYYSGGVKGETGREYLEKGVALCSSGPEMMSFSQNAGGENFCEELYFPLGAYSYFAGRLPNFLKALNFLWFLPKGAAEEGLLALKRASQKSILHGMSAKLVLISIYQLFEKDHLKDALHMSNEIISRFPDNSYLDLQHADILLATGSYEKAAEHAENILKKVENKFPFYNTGVGLQAKLTIAETLICQQKTENAILLLKQLKKEPAYQAHTYTSKIYLLLGMAKDAQHKREDALRYYTLTLEHNDRMLGRIVKKRARQYMEASFLLPIYG